MNNRLKAYLALLSNAAIWGFALPMAKKAFSETTPMTFLFYRYVFATLSGLPIMIIFWKKLKFGLKQLPEMTANGFVSTVLTLWILYLGLARTSALEASVITLPASIFIVIGGAIFLKEKVTGREKFGTVVAFIGSLLLVIEPLFFNHQNVSFSHALGNLLSFSYNFLWAISALWMKKIAHKYHPFTLVYISFVVGLIGFFPLALIENPLLLTQNYFTLPYATLASVYMGIFGSTLAVFLYQYGQKLIEASEATLFTYLSAIFSAPLAVIWLGEKLTLPFVIGGFIIIAGVAIAESRRPAKFLR